MKITRAALAAGIAAAGAVTVAACGPTVAKTPAATTPPASTSPAAVFTPAPTTPASPSPVTSGPLGTSFTITTTDNSGNAVVYTVTASRIDQHAGLTPYETLTNPADHMAAVRFTITGVTGQESDDANSVASVTGADTTEYSASFSGVSDGPNFSSGEFEVGPGQAVSGWVAFEVPAGGTVASVAWQPGFQSPAATWTLGA
jgi:hypothetical protein